jgi:hypothetical protein
MLYNLLRDQGLFKMQGTLFQLGQVEGGTKILDKSLKQKLAMQAFRANQKLHTNQS